MRSIILVIVTAVLLSGVFFVYIKMQDSDPQSARTAPKGRSSRKSAALPTTQSGLSDVQGVWIDHYDEKTKTRDSRIRADRYEPQPDGRVLVVNPEAEFFLHNDNVMRLKGKTGYVRMQERPNKLQNVPGGSRLAQSPQSGELYDVTLRIYESPEDPEPSLTMTMPNASFDNETFRVATEAYRDGGTLVPADRVPVSVRGEYEFDGQGLRLQYNELDRRLEYLRIAHGGRLLIKDSARILQTDPREKPQATPAVPVAGQVVRVRHALQNWVPTSHETDDNAVVVLDDALVSADPGAVILVAAKAPPTPRTPTSRPTARRTTVEPVYRATFQGDLEIYQGNQQIAGGDQMQIDFLSRDDRATALHVDAGQPAATRPIRRPPATRPATRPSSRPSRRPALAPTTRQTDEPIEIRWNGPLTIVPLPGDRPARIAPGEAIVHLTGQKDRPVLVRQRSEQSTSELRCAALTYWTIDRGAVLEEAPGVPVTMADSRGAKIVTHAMNVSDADGTAMLSGKSHAELPLDEPGKPAGVAGALMKLDWDERCILHFQDVAGEQLLMKKAQITGAVAIDHPQLKLNCESLDMRFSSLPATRPATAKNTPAQTIEGLHAQGNVQCEVNGPAGDADRRKLACDSLTLATAQAPDGRLYAHTLNAIGKVRAVDPEWDMRASALNVVLDQPTTRPTTRPSSAKIDAMPGQLRWMDARGSVRIVAKDGKSAECDMVTINAEGATRRVTLQGAPAIVRRENDSLSGSIITMVPETQELLVSGAGTLKGVQKSEGDKYARPVEITWARSLSGRGDTVECLGDVVATTYDADGAVNTARGHSVILATTRPATPATRPATTRPSSDLDVMANRVIQSLSLVGTPDKDALVHSELKDVAGKLLRLFEINAQRIQYTQPTETQRRLLIPGAGQMIFIDDRPPATQPSATQPAVAAVPATRPFGADPLSVRGKTAFSWKKHLAYDSDKEQIELVGDVMVARVDQGADDDPMRLSADRITADIEPPPQSDTRPAIAGPDIATRMQLKRVRAEGAIAIRSRKISIDAEAIDYDPIKHVLIARGADRRPIIKYDENDLPEFTAEEITINTETGDFSGQKNMVRVRRRVDPPKPAN